MVNGGRYMVFVGTSPAEEGHRPCGRILCRHGAERPLDLQLSRHPGKVDGAVKSGSRWHIDEQVIDRFYADGGQHGVRGR